MNRSYTALIFGQEDIDFSLLRQSNRTDFYFLKPPQQLNKRLFIQSHFLASSCERTTAAHFFDKFPHFIFGALLITARLNPFECFLLMHNLWKILMQSMQKLIHDFILIF